MYEALSDLKDTIDINREDMLNDKVLTGDLVVEDFLVMLGYNWKRDKQVRKSSDSLVDWTINKENLQSIAIKVYALGTDVENIDKSDISVLAEYCSQKAFNILLLTNGAKLRVMRTNLDTTSEYTDIITLDLTSDLSDNEISVLDAISKDRFNIVALGELSKSSVMSKDKLVKLITDNFKAVTDTLVRLSGAKDVSDEATNQFKDALTELIENKPEVVEDTAKVDQLNQVVLTLTTENTQLKTQLQTQAQNNTSTVSSEELESYKDKIRNLEARLTTADKTESYADELKQSLALAEGSKSELESRINELENSLNAVKEENASLKEAASASNSGDGSTSAEDKQKIIAYRNKIIELTTEVADLKSDVNKAKAEAQKAIDEMNSMSGVEVRQAEELLACIEDSDTLERHYVAVVNTELMQYDEIHTFVGRVLQKLYEIRGNEASQYIFNAELFILKQPAVRNDLLMNNKQYDVEFNNDNEDDVLNKLRILFSHFDPTEVVFRCKKIGNEEVTKRKAAEKLAQQAAENELDEAEYASDLAAASDDEDIFTDDTSDSNLGEAESDEIQPTPDFGDNDSFTVPEEENSTDTFGQQDSFGDFFESDSDENNTEDSFGDFQDVESDNQDNNEFPEFIDDESNNNDSDFIDDTESYSESDMDAFPSFDNEENEGTQFTDNDNNFFGDDTQDSESDTFEPDAFGSDSFEPDSDESADDNNSMTIDDEVIQSLLNAQSDESEGSEEQYTEFADESDNQQYTEYSEQPQYDEQPEYDEQPQYDEQQYTESADEQSVLFVAQMSALDQLVWSDEVTFDNIPYIGNNTITYNINKNGSLNTYEDVLCKCIEAVIAIDSNNGNTNIVSMFKKKDLSTVSNFIKLYTDEYKGCTRIKGTKYVITSVDSMSQVATILYDICSALGIDTDTTFIYFYVTTSSQALINDWSYAEDAVQLREFTEYVVDNQVREKTSVAILKGEMFDRITVTKNSLKAHRDIIKKVEAVKTKEVAKKLDTVKDLQETVAEMIQSYINQNNHVDNIRYAAFGVALGTSYRLISENPAEVGPDPIPLELINKTVYMCNLQEWQIVYALIKVHTVLFNNGGIAIKTSVDQNAINFYGEEFESSEPALSLAVKSFVDYVALSITQTNTKSAQNNQ